MLRFHDIFVNSNSKEEIRYGRTILHKRIRKYAEHKYWRIMWAEVSKVKPLKDWASEFHNEAVHATRDQGKYRLSDEYNNFY